MQIQENCHENVWILSGTADGPILADKLIKLNFVVFASVVTYRGGTSYQENPKLHIITGKINGIDQFIKFINKNKIDYIIDATHPFALRISENLIKACQKINKPFFRFERNLRNLNNKNFNYVEDPISISGVNWKNKKLLLAIGSRFLDTTASFYLDKGADVFARILPTSESISLAFRSRLKKSHIAILEPSKNKFNNLERNLCHFWKIDYVLCRDSGGYSQNIWEQMHSEGLIKLFLIQRPEVGTNVLLFSEYDDLINKMNSIHSFSHE